MKNEIESKKNKDYASIVRLWLIVGLIMIFVQVILGGITRLTGSGLSITKWDIVTGTLPPLNAEQWTEAFELYKATPQYEKINEGMELGQFKFIFFWEYFHRLWARLMGFVFIIPFLIFWAKGMIDKILMKRLGTVLLLAAVVASFGWIMVASGLEDRPWVNAYKLSLHLSLAFILYSYLLWVIFQTLNIKKEVINNKVLKRNTLAILAIVAVQIILGGINSGMKAGLYYPTWPDMNGFFIPSILTNSANWTVENLVNYDQFSFMPAIVQFVHRLIAYLLIIIGLWYFLKARTLEVSTRFKAGLLLFVSMLIIQVLLGIFTVIYCLGKVPLTLGVLHQAGALLLLSILLFLLYLQGKKNT
ncbi:MAG: COX15/CtaA family protein [Saprospiraceae bacterium]|nr:COX15/CtaA family protein [Saprospiraceae bacterium]MCB9324898.1 COX15/CtaA family protein [Lewinellaceae bacterium]